MAKTGKKYAAAKAQVEERPYALDEAIPLVMFEKTVVTLIDKEIAH